MSLAQDSNNLMKGGKTIDWEVCFLDHLIGKNIQSNIESFKIFQNNFFS